MLILNPSITSYHIYKLSFLNFLLGKQPNGPGQFMFGVVEWDGVTKWLDIDTMAPERGDTVTQGEPELISSNDNKKNGGGDDIKLNNSTRRQRSDKRRPTEPRSIVEVIDKNGTRRKSIIV